MIDPPTVAPLGDPGIRVAPTPAVPSLVAAPPQLMLRLKKSEWRSPIVWPNSCISSGPARLIGSFMVSWLMLIALNGRPPDGNPEELPVPVVTCAVITALHPNVPPDVRVM